MTRVTENFDGYPAGSSLNWQSVNNGFITPALAAATSAPNAGQAASSPGVRLAVNAGAVGSMNDDVSCAVNVYVATPTNPSGCAGAYLAGISDRFDGHAATLFWDGAEVAVRLSQLSSAGTTATALLEAPTTNTLTSHWYTVELRYDPASAQMLAYCYAVGGSRGAAILSYPIDLSA